MISVTKLRNGACFEVDGQPFRVVNYQHTHMSRGGGTVKVKVKNLKDGSALTKAFKSTEKVEDINITKKQMQYLYQDGANYVFMNQEDYTQLEVPAGVLEDEAVYFKEGESVYLLIWDDADMVLGADIPPKMTFEIIEAAPGEKGDSASNVYKDAILENGLKIRVPLFVNAGEKIRVDTRDGSYVERA